jgi:hypothetical protein
MKRVMLLLLSCLLFLPGCAVRLGPKTVATCQHSMQRSTRRCACATRWLWEVTLMTLVYTVGLYVWRTQTALEAATWYVLPGETRLHFTWAGCW